MKDHMKAPDDKKFFFKVRLRIAILLVITENFSNLAAQFLLMGENTVSASGSLQLCSLSLVFKKT